MLIAVCVGWVVKRAVSRDELASLGDGGFALWYFLIRFVVPPALLVIFVFGVLG
jgi:NSS family neurotransmitter:Na+ symporter